MKAHLKHIAMIAGFGAAATALAIATAQPDFPPSGGSIPVAGSGSAPVNTSYSPPSVADMNMGQTLLDRTTPPSVLDTPVAVPPVKAG